jgi:hypothetical protein
MTDEQAPSLSTVMLVMDETESVETGIFALVGLLVPIETADALRLEHYRFIRSLRPQEPGVINLSTLELHGSNMLRDERGEDMSWAKVLAFGPKHHSLCFSGFMMSLGDEFAKAYVIPIMDGLDLDVATKLGAMVDVCGAYRSASLGDQGLSVKNSHNLMDPVFVDSRYSPLMQIADVTAHLFHVLDWEREGLSMSEFKTRLAAIAKELDPDLISNPLPIAMRVHGVSGTES